MKEILAVGALLRECADGVDMSPHPSRGIVIIHNPAVGALLRECTDGGALSPYASPPINISRLMRVVIPEAVYDSKDEKMVKFESGDGLLSSTAKQMA